MATTKPRISAEERENLRSLANACTAGPWRVLRDQASREAVRGRTSDAEDDFDIDPVCQIIAEQVWGHHDDLFLMAASREAIPKLLDEIERLEAMTKLGSPGSATIAPAQKAALTRKRRAAGSKAATTKRRRAAGRKAAVTKTRRAAGKKAAVTKKRRVSARKAAVTRKSRKT